MWTIIITFSIYRIAGRHPLPTYNTNYTSLYPQVTLQTDLLFSDKLDVRDLNLCVNVTVTVLVFSLNKCYHDSPSVDPPRPR
jgi:hypothetical protein